MIRTRIGRRLLGLLAAIGTLALVACSGSVDSAPATAAQSPTQATGTPSPALQTERPAGGRTQLDETQVAALAACLRGRGFEVPDDAMDLQALFGGGPPSAELQDALGECGAEVGVTLPGGFGGDGGGFGGGRGGFGGTQLDETQVAALAGCLQERGFEVPDDATNLQALFGGGPPSAELQEALGECGTEVGITLPGGFGGGRQ